MAVLAVALASQAQARTLDQVPPYLKKEGNFVAYPAIALGGVGMVLGAVISLPATAVAAPIGWAAGDPLAYTLVPGSVLATGGAEAGYHVGGAIPWLLKNGFYDAPMNAVARIKGEPLSGLVAQVEPAPPPPSDLQYLDTTPPDARVPVVLARRYSSALPPPKPLNSMMLRRQMSPFKAPPLPGQKAVPPVVRAAPPAAAPAPVVPAGQQGMAPANASISSAPAAAPAVAPEPAASLPVPSLPVPVAPARPVVAPVAAAPAVSRPPSRTAPVEKAPEPAAVEVPAADAGTGDGTDGRPSLKKKRKFSERFGF